MVPLKSLVSLFYCSARLRVFAGNIDVWECLSAI